MPIEIELQDDGAGVIFVCHGVLSGKDLIDAHNCLLASPETVQKCKYCIVDEMAVDGVEISASEIRATADLSKRLAPIAPAGTKVCIAAPKDAAFGLARMWEVFAQETGWETTTVRSRAEADAWVERKLRSKARVDPVA